MMKSFNMMRQLNNWLGTCYAEEHGPLVIVSVAADGVAITIGGETVWDSENDHEEDLTLEYCKSRLYEVAMSMMVPFD